MYEETNFPLHGVTFLCPWKQIIYGGMQEVSKEFSEQLESGKAVVKLVLYKPPENKEILPPRGPDDDAEPKEDTEDDALARETDAIFGAVKVIYGCYPTEAEGQPSNIDPER